MTLEKLKELWQRRKEALKTIEELDRNMRFRRKEIVRLDEEINRLLG